jgi:hypothetical protein
MSKLSRGLALLVGHGEGGMGAAAVGELANGAVDLGDLGVNAGHRTHLLGEARPWTFGLPLLS